MAFINLRYVKEKKKSLQAMKMYRSFGFFDCGQRTDILIITINFRFLTYKLISKFDFQFFKGLTLNGRELINSQKLSNVVNLPNNKLFVKRFSKNF